jgi:hypothetical protein
MTDCRRGQALSVVKSTDSGKCDEKHGDISSRIRPVRASSARIWIKHQAAEGITFAFALSQLANA